MPTKNTANDYKLRLDGREYPVEKFDFTTDLSELDSTDSTTAKDGTEVEAGRNTRKSAIETLLYAADSAPITSGDLTADQKYRVTAGSVVEGGVTHVVGDIFTSDGTGAVSSENIVVALGKKITGKAISCSIGGKLAPVTSLKYSISFKEEAATDSFTAANENEIIVGRGKRSSTVEIIQMKEEADLIQNDPTAVATVLTLTPTMTITGKAMLLKLGGNVASSDSAAVKQSYELVWIGKPLLSADLAAALLPTVSAHSMELIYAKGTTTDRKYVGSAVITSVDISVDVNSMVKVAYKASWQGAVTASVVS